MQKKILFLFLLFIKINGQSQSFDVASLHQQWIDLKPFVTHNIVFKNGTSDSIKPLIDLKSINGKNYTQNHHLYFSIKNSGNTIDSVYFFIGHWLNFSANRVIGKYILPQNITKVHLNVINNEVPMLKIIIQPNDSANYEIIPQIRNFNFNYVKPHLIQPLAINDFGYAYYFNDQKGYLYWTFVFLGVLFSMFLYAIISWTREKTSEYLYYGIYVLLFILYFMVRVYTMIVTSYSILQHNSFAIHFTQVLGYMFYIHFAIVFLQLKTDKPWLYKFLKSFNYILFFYLLLDIYLIYFSRYIYIAITLNIVIRFLILTASLIVIFQFFKIKQRMHNYIAWGLVFLFLFGSTSLFFSATNIKTSHFYNFFDIRIPLYQIGIAIELILFTMALQYKSNLRNKNSIIEIENMRVENEKKEFETFIAIIGARDKERTRIAQEIHDDIGSGLTSIRLLSEIAKAKYTNNEMVEIDKISSSASELMENMNEIIWSINSKNDNLSNLIAYVRSYIVTYFENFEEIVVKTKIPEIIPDIQISGDFRRSTFLVVKESLHNIIKHANATTVTLNIEINHNQLYISINDNGKGFDPKDAKQFSNGLKNMRERIENLGGNFSIVGYNGSSVIINLPL